MNDVPAVEMTIDDLPLLIWEKIIGLLVLEDIFNCRQICSLLKRYADNVLRRKDRVYLSSEKSLMYQCFEKKHFIPPINRMVVDGYMDNNKWRNLALLMPNIQILNVRVECQPLSIMTIVDIFSRMSCFTSLNVLEGNSEDHPCPGVRHLKVPMLCGHQALTGIESLEVSKIDPLSNNKRIPQTCRRLISKSINTFPDGSFMEWGDIPPCLQVLHASDLDFSGYSRRFKETYPHLKELDLSFFTLEGDKSMNFLLDNQTSLTKLSMNLDFNRIMIVKMLPVFNQLEKLVVHVSTEDAIIALRDGLASSTRLKDVSVIAKVRARNIPFFLQSLPRMTKSINIRTLLTEVLPADAVKEMVFQALMILRGSGIPGVNIMIKCYTTLSADFTIDKDFPQFIIRRWKEDIIEDAPNGMFGLTIMSNCSVAPNDRCSHEKQSSKVLS
jgi:hypothetical protein